MNKKLRNDPRQDPEQGKVQFPDRQQCPACHGPNVPGQKKWVKPEVLAFLIRFYQQSSVLSDTAESQAKVPPARSTTAAPGIVGTNDQPINKPGGTCTRRISTFQLKKIKSYVQYFSGDVRLTLEHYIFEDLI